MNVTIEKGKIKVVSPYNRDYISRAKQIQGKWVAPCWEFPEENKDQVKDLLIECYGECGILGDVNTVNIEIDLDKYNGEVNETIKLGAMTLVSRPHRDRAVVFAPNVMLVTGGFDEAGGSAKYPRVCAHEGTVLRVKNVPDTIYNKVKDYAGIRLISDIDTENLKTEREKLLRRLAEIDDLLAKTI